MISIILLAGGSGVRMNLPTPKQFLKLKNKPLVLYSYEVLKDFGEVIVVADKSYHSLFPANTQFAEPGKRRQDSLFNGLAKASHDLVLVHDAARPFISKTLVQDVIDAAKESGASVPGCPISSTIKERDDLGYASKTLDRSVLWEIQTPQAVRRDILLKGFEKANKEGLTVTDDASLAELAGCSVKICMGSRRNIKITTPEDLQLAEFLYAEI